MPIRETAADIRATRITIRATAAGSREIASEWWPCASTSQEMAVNIEEIAGYARRNAAAVRRLPAAWFSTVTINKSIPYAHSLQK